MKTIPLSKQKATIVADALHIFAANATNAEGVAWAKDLADELRGHHLDIVVRKSEHRKILTKGTHDLRVIKARQFYSQTHDGIFVVFTMTVLKTDSTSLVVGDELEFVCRVRWDDPLPSANINLQAIVNLSDSEELLGFARRVIARSYMLHHDKTAPPTEELSKLDFKVRAVVTEAEREAREGGKRTINIFRFEAVT